MDIAQQSKEITLVLNEEGFVSTLKQVADPVVAKVKPLSVKGVERQHGARKSDGSSLEREVNVVAHEAVTQHPKPEF